jgi:predicted DNA-binding transcriptional regulator AlpA
MLNINPVLPPGGMSRQKTIKPHLPFSNATLWRMVKSGDFPAPIKITPFITAWRNDDINEWFAERVQR